MSLIRNLIKKVPFLGSITFLGGSIYLITDLIDLNIQTATKLELLAAYDKTIVAVLFMSISIQYIIWSEIQEVNNNNE